MTGNLVNRFRAASHRFAKGLLVPLVIVVALAISGCGDTNSGSDGKSSQDGNSSTSQPTQDEAARKQRLKSLGYLNQ